MNDKVADGLNRPCCENDADGSRAACVSNCNMFYLIKPVMREHYLSLASKGSGAFAFEFHFDGQHLLYELLSFVKYRPLLFQSVRTVVER